MVSRAWSHTNVKLRTHRRGAQRLINIYAVMSDRPSFAHMTRHGLTGGQPQGILQRIILIGKHDGAPPGTRSASTSSVTVAPAVATQRGSSTSSSSPPPLHSLSLHLLASLAVSACARQRCSTRQTSAGVLIELPIRGCGDTTWCAVQEECSRADGLCHHMRAYRQLNRRWL